MSLSPGTCSLQVYMLTQSNGASGLSLCSSLYLQSACMAPLSRHDRKVDMYTVPCIMVVTKARYSEKAE